MGLRICFVGPLNLLIQASSRTGTTSRIQLNWHGGGWVDVGCYSSVYLQMDHKLDEESFSGMAPRAAHPARGEAQNFGTSAGFVSNDALFISHVC